ncbi:putative HTH-type transcriptional regulator GltR [[Clostridium] asparagiforme DSM 15981]|uniref:Putative HTH-type transcriptional regulator GltR n=1 Tax=[Clostridium] asparagiforme DSM 15981 TaxID=518636 RepID=C0CWN2_9FIRM|nr:putative HTH-type transcriptional regulator GltR [[Clostridium] asparagiforme DSM 15981]
MGVQLFDRLPKGITLTRPGEVLLKHARSLLLEAENARLAVKSQREPSGKLRIGAFSSLCTAFLPDLLRQYHQLYPKVDLVVRSGGIEALRDMLGSGRLDFAWVIADWKERSPWRAFCGMSHPIWAVAAPGRYGPGKILPASGLEDVTFLLTEPGCPYRRQFELFCSKNGIVPHVLMEADSIEGIRTFARSGLGVGILPDFAVRSMVQEGALERVRIEGFTPAVESALFCHPVKWMTPAMEAFLQLSGARERAD